MSLDFAMSDTISAPAYSAHYPPEGLSRSSSTDRYASESTKRANRALSESRNVLNKMDQMLAAADSVAAQARTEINGLLSFSHEVSGVTYSPPRYVTADLKILDGTGDFPSLDTPNVETFAFSGDLALPAHSGATASVPVIGDIQISDAPAQGALSSAPTAPTVADIALEDAPEVAFNLRTVPTLPMIDAPPELGIDTAQFQPLTPFAFAEVDDLDEAVARLQAVRSRVPAMPDYTQLIPEVFDVVGSLLAGDLVVPVQDMLSDGAQARAKHDALLGRLWARRGLASVADEHLNTYLGVAQAKADQDVVRSNAIAMAQWKDDALRVAYVVGVGAHTMLMDIELGVYDQQFAATLATAEVNVELAKAMAAAYNAAVAQYNARADLYAAGLAQLSALVARYKSLADVESAKGQMNSAIASAFGAREKVKSVQADEYKARIRLEAAKIEGFKAQMDALAAKAGALEVNTERYKGQVLEWVAGIEHVKAEYSAYSSRMRGVIAQNRGEQVRQEITRARNEAVAAQAQGVAATVSAQAATLKAQAASRAASYDTIRLTNAVESGRAQMQGAVYDVEIARWSASLQGKIGEAEGAATQGSETARYYVAVSEAAGRAAQLTQTANIQLANAYATANEAAGRAGAAIASGQLSGFRASASLSAQASISGTQSWGNANSASFTSSVSESDNATQSLSA